MKQNIAKVLTFSLLATSAVFISCVDNEKNLFDAEQLRQIYEEISILTETGLCPVV